jgi:hypothetical protein
VERVVHQFILLVEVDTMVALGVEVNIAAGAYLATDWFRSNDNFFVGRDAENRIVFVTAEIRSNHLLSKGSDGTIVSQKAAEKLTETGAIALGDHVVHIIAKRLRSVSAGPDYMGYMGHVAQDPPPTSSHAHSKTCS